jgi:flagellar capping protein FliD
MAKTKKTNMIIGGATAVASLGILIGTIALAFEANDTTLPEKPKQIAPSKTTTSKRPTQGRFGSRSSIRTPTTGRKRSFNRRKPPLNDAVKRKGIDTKTRRHLTGADLKRRDIAKRPDPSNLRLRRTSEMTPEERQQRRKERRQRQKDNLSRRIDSLAERIETAKSDGTRSEQQIERMEKSLQRMKNRLQQLEEREANPAVGRTPY